MFPHSNQGSKDGGCPSLYRLQHAEVIVAIVIFGVYKLKLFDLKLMDKEAGSFLFYLPSEKNKQTHYTLQLKESRPNSSELDHLVRSTNQDPAMRLFFL